MNRLALIKQIAERLQSERAGESLRDSFLTDRIAAYTLKQEYIEIENNLNNELLELDFN